MTMLGTTAECNFINDSVLDGSSGKLRTFADGGKASKEFWSAQKWRMEEDYHKTGVHGWDRKSPHLITVS